MYSYIKGIVTEITSKSITIENNNIGYLVFVANPYEFKIDKDAKVFLYQQVKEDDLSLFGFISVDEKELFLKLISVKGVGSKTAMPIIAAGSIAGVADAIERENVLYLKKFPKIGEKVARQIILDLKGKIELTEVVIEKHDELTEVLIGLGYKPSDIKRIIPKIDSELPIEVQIKESLKLMLK